MTDTKALIAEAREETRYQEKHGGDKVMAKLLRKLSDALEKAQAHILKLDPDLPAKTAQLAYTEGFLPEDERYRPTWESISEEERNGWRRVAKAFEAANDQNWSTDCAESGDK